MSLYPELATLDDLAAFLGKATSALPADSARLITRASELVTQAMWHNFIATDENHVESAKLATCAQIEYWFEIGESMAFVGNVKDLAIGSFKIGFGGSGSGQDSTTTLAPRARSFLSRQGLLYRGM